MAITDYYTSLLIQERISTGSFDAQTWQDVGSYNGFIQPVFGKENYRDGKAGEQATHMLYTDLNTPAKYGYKVTQNGQSYIIIYAIQPAGISGVAHHKEVLMQVFE